ADPARAELALDWCEALLTAGQVGPAADAIAELGRWLAADGASAARLRGWHTCFAAQRAVLTDPQALRATAATVAAAAEPLAAAAARAGAGGGAPRGRGEGPLGPRGGARRARRGGGGRAPPRRGAGGAPPRARPPACQRGARERPARRPLGPGSGDAGERPLP